jgi:TATA-box binding protein (TBP) (component of TFIID and TFIIIB)
MMMVTERQILNLLSHQDNIDTILDYNCPIHLEKQLDQTCMNKIEKPDYPKPSEIRVSTMTTICYVSTKVHMKPLFYLIPCGQKNLLEPNDQEKAQLNIKTTRKRKKTAVERNPNENDFQNYLKAFIQSGWVTFDKKAYCPLNVFMETFEQYCLTRNWADKFDRYAHAGGEWGTKDEPKRIVAALLRALFDDNPLIRLEQVSNDECIVYPKVQRFYERACKTKTKYYNPTIYNNGEWFVVGMDVKSIFPCIMEIKHQNLARSYDDDMTSVQKTSSKAFYNQCSMRIALHPFKEINMKMFKNGKMQMTGCKAISDVEDAIRYLTHEIETMSYTMHLHNKLDTELKVTHFTEPLPEIITQSLPDEVWHKIFSFLTPCELVEKRMVCKRFNGLILDNHFWLNRIEKEQLCHFRYEPASGDSGGAGKWTVYEKYHSRYGIYKKIYKPIHFTNPMKYYAETINDKPVLPFIPIERRNTIDIIDVEIAMINSDFQTNFNINQPLLTTLLQHNYGLFVKYDPISYPGVNVKYKEDTILIFRTGKVIITGAKSYEDIEEGYRFINQVFKKHYEVIWTESDE